ncbi:MAG: type II secretion system protein GspJ [Candidatus Pelagibacter sp. TMED128]|nr:MAG: type II secretion system protein GspJ [Candidatus Pelagibacter sp. TMED128]|tara:strand:- start:2242 stop:2835 length:594 start_codon:yes stop_codon:yes gene_type:complete
MSKGFTLIEVLVSLVILSMITIITSNILQSSLETERTSSERLQSASALNFSSIILRRDLRQIINVPLRDYYGNTIKGTFSGSNIDKRILFNSKIKSISNEISPIKRIEYVLDDNKLIRKQFFSSNPYNSDESIKSNFIEEISDLDIKFMHERSWYDRWPVSPVTERQIPTLIKLEFKKSGKEYIWIIEPNIDYVFKR